MSSHRSRPGPPAGPPGAPGDPVPQRRRRTGVLAATAVLVLGLDLVSKVMVVAELLHGPPVKLPGDFIWLVHARNPGAAFSFAEGATVVFTAVAAIVIAVIVRTASKLRSTAWAVSLGLVLGGAAGNLVDRLFRSPAPLRGWVVDWISLRSPDGKMLFPIFNLADSGIVCGGILAVLLAVLGYEMDGTRGGRDPAARAAGPATPPTPSGPAPGPGGPVPRTLTPPAPSGPARGPGCPVPRTLTPPGWNPAGAPAPGRTAGADGYVPSSGPVAGPPGERPADRGPVRWRPADGPAGGVGG